MTNGPPTAVEYLVDESRIVVAQDATINASALLRDHVGIINEALNLLSEIPRLHQHQNDDELVLLRLVVRCFNSGAASLRLLRGGYYQPAMAMVRDLIEIQFLLDLFKKQPAKVTEWRSLPNKERERAFSPVKLRIALDDLDGYVDRKREAAYKLFSGQAAHAAPNGFTLISPSQQTQIGPFPNEALLKACIEELAKHLGYVAVLAAAQPPLQTPNLIGIKLRYLETLDTWAKEYMRTSD